MVTSGHLPVLPEFGEVTPQSTTPEPSEVYTSLKESVTGVAPSFCSMADMVGVKLRIFRPLKSATDLTGLEQ